MINLNNNKSYVKITLPKKFETIVNKDTNKSAWKYIKPLFQSKSIQPPFVNAYDFDTMIVETDDKSKLELLRKN